MIQGKNKLERLENQSYVCPGIVAHLNPLPQYVAMSFCDGSKLEIISREK